MTVIDVNSPNDRQGDEMNTNNVNVCGTCGGEGDCPDCDTLTIEAARERLAWLQRGLLSVVLPSAFTAEVAIIEAYIARREAMQTAPVTDPRPDCPLCSGDGINAAGGASCPACNGSGYEPDEPALPWYEQGDVLQRLNSAVIVYHDSGFDKALYQDAAAEIRALRSALGVTQHTAAMLDREITSLRAELFAERGAHAETTKALREVLAGHAVTEVRQVEDGAWVAVGKSVGVNYQSIECRTKEQAQADAGLFAERHNRELIRRATR